MHKQSLYIKLSVQCILNTETWTPLTLYLKQMRKTVSDRNIVYVSSRNT